MKIKERVLGFAYDHPVMTGAIIFTAGCLTLGYTYTKGMISGVAIANEALKEAAIIEPGITVSNFMLNNGVISKT